VNDWQPVEVPFDAPLGEDVARTPLSRWEIEWLAAYGPLAPGESIPAERER
jgi:hypothetical protein